MKAHTARQSWKNHPPMSQLLSCKLISFYVWILLHKPLVCRVQEMPRRDSSRTEPLVDKPSLYACAMLSLRAILTDAESLPCLGGLKFQIVPRKQAPAEIYLQSCMLNLSCWSSPLIWCCRSQDSNHASSTSYGFFARDAERCSVSSSC